MVESHSPKVQPEKPRKRLPRITDLPVVRTILRKFHLPPATQSAPASPQQLHLQASVTLATEGPDRGHYGKARSHPSAEAYAAAAAYTPLVDPEHVSDSKGSLYNIAGEQLLAAPNPDLVTQLQQADERISYFVPQASTSHRDTNLRPTADGRLPLRGSVGEYEFFELVTNPLTQQLFVELKTQLAKESGKTLEQMNELPIDELSKLLNERFAFRGIACSVNGPIIDEARGMLVKDIRQILADGGEKTEEGANVGGIHLDATTGKPELLHHVNKGFISGPMGIELHYPHEIARVFPALLVYDRRQLTRVPNTPYANALPKTPEGRRAVIEKAYILPRSV